MPRFTIPVPALLACFLFAVPGRADTPDQKVLFESGKEGYHTFRIPALAATPKGTLIAICEGRKTSRSDHGDVDLVFKRSTDGGRTWSPAKLLYEEGNDAKITIGNPCVVVDQKTGIIWLLLTRDNDRVLVTSSRDEGLTWEKPRDITEPVKPKDWTWYATGPGNGIQLVQGPHRGRLVIPCDHRHRGIANKQESTRSHVIYSDDHGQTWKLGGATEGFMNECGIVELADGHLLLNMRSYRGKGLRGLAFSKDAGLTWSPVQDDPTLIEPVCQASLIRFSWKTAAEKSILVFANPADKKVRKNMTVRLSFDEGKTWPVSKVLHPGSAQYSALARLPDGSLGLLYERENYSEIIFARLPLDWLLP